MCRVGPDSTTALAGTAEAAGSRERKSRDSIPIGTESSDPTPGDRRLRAPVEDGHPAATASLDVMPTRTAPHTPEKLEWSDDDEANRLIAHDPLALLIGFVLDQQVTVEKAFYGPKLLRERVGTLDAGRLARLDPAELARAFAGPPAIHRFPSAMAERVQALCALVDQRYQGDAERIWKGVTKADDLRARLLELPGFGAAKVAITMAVLAEHFGVRPQGWRRLVPSHPTLAGVTTRDQRITYQTQKREHKRRMREEAAR
ncbi:MAG: hypothetical protein NVS3B18_04160 [Candidatus Dormibacteria bacterium]